MVDTFSMREEILQRRLRQSTSLELIEEMIQRLRRRETQSIEANFIKMLDRQELEDAHFETLMKIIEDEKNISFKTQDARFDRLFHLFVLLMLNDGFEVIEFPNGAE